VFFRQAGLTKKAFELVTIIRGGPVAIKIALLALNFLYQLNFALPERIYSQTLGEASNLIHFH
jgi:hypothetical protein